MGIDDGAIGGNHLSCFRVAIAPQLIGFVKANALETGVGVNVPLSYFTELPHRGATATTVDLYVSDVTADVGTGNAVDAVFAGRDGSQLDFPTVVT